MKMASHLFIILLNTKVYPVHLADIKFGELVRDVNWRVFSLVTRAIYGYR